VLLVQSLWGHWSFPKWHLESQETPLQAARREVFEETGISSITVLPNAYFDHYYSFFIKRWLVNKRVGFFVGEVYDTRVSLQKSELKNFCWKDLSWALVTLTFESDKEILRKVWVLIEKEIWI
jgi:8-oxo-dGTP pyrophosphatase MutT (NUDIX family)